jgi:Leucine-rich repeat (LRR) protein
MHTAVACCPHEPTHPDIVTLHLDFASMVHTRAQRRVEAAAEHSMTGGSATLPDELLLRVLEHVMLAWDGEKEWRGGVRGVSRTWRALHDGACTSLRMRNGVTDEVMHALCGRLPALKTLFLDGVTSLTADGLLAVGGLTALTYLNLGYCNVTDAVLRELRGLTELSWLYLDRCTLVTDVGVRELRDLTALRTLDLSGCTHVTDAGLQHLMSLTALSQLNLLGTSTTQAGRNALKAVLPALTIY